MNGYYNTNDEKGAELKASNKKADAQENIILDIFKVHRKLSASEAWRYYCNETNKTQVPITSIRRAITNLCNDNQLIKTKEMATGIYGKKEHIYELKVPNKIQMEMF